MGRYLDYASVSPLWSSENKMDLANLLKKLIFVITQRTTLPHKIVTSLFLDFVQNLGL